MEETRWFHVRPIFFLVCFVVLVLWFVPRLIGSRHGIQQSFFFFACVAVAMGWFFFLKYREVNGLWRSSVFVLASACLTASLPLFLVELSGGKFMFFDPRHHWFSAYESIWITRGFQGYIPVILGLVGSVFGSGRSRFAFLLGGLALLALRESMGAWVL